MGYFDDDYGQEQTKKRRWLFPALIGVFIGIAVVLVALPGILESDMLPEAWTEDAETVQDENGNGAQPESGDYVSVNVSSQITDVVNNVSPAVVGVINIQRQGDYWQQQDGQQQTEAGSGSGVIYKNTDGNAYVITNHHVIQGADTVEVVLSDDTRIEAEILGSDLFSDLAVLQMNGDQVKDTIEMGTSENIKVGEPAIAIGNPLGMFLGSVTQGVISGTQRTIPQDFNQDGRADWQAEVIQTDAAINPGNSGGALINIDGQLIGINSMKINQEAVEGIGFAIPIDTARPIVDELEQTGQVTRPYMGVEIYSLEEVPQTEWSSTLNLPDEVEGGVYVWTVEPGTPADQAGLTRLDVITTVDGEEVMNMIDLRKILYQEKEVGDSLTVTFYRDGQQQEATFELVEQR
ncbi:htrA-like peptidase. Serine peptidase. MEROPS family S01B [Lentibacillus halodurans]|uniref:HtrA-like peptidase. Serine peptidase. MEROPS family S01B n=1 Tax=Lentibacillus halodurans TaxID=237679 RepID=A0A1I1A0U4_9BACI|nr:trypsin-like peptidase domain-containing protein [Lentibacillus halodurans]SFB30188.1 htrA-like peptidase. Serine peptidase. MEROPS family S01B [Lentibacillus halodurans]